MSTKNAVAFANNDVVTIAWSYGKKPTGCLGFAIYRIDSKGKETPLPSHAVFPGGTIADGQTTAEFPVQKFYWKDVEARHIADKTGSRDFRYKIVPLEGTPGALQPMKSLGQLITNEVTVTGDTGAGLTAIFNRGLISTQKVSKATQDKKLLPQVQTPGNALRNSLAGDMIATLTAFTARAKDEGEIFAALYELSDKQLLASLTALGGRLNIVLSNMEPNPETGAVKDGDAAARAALENSQAQKFDRLVDDQHIAHNKFLVYVDKNGDAKAVLYGSTNWTPTGLCTQTNNTIVIEDDKLAARYLAYWRQLAKDTETAAGVAANAQGAALRKFGAKGASISRADGSQLRSWFSPNTPGSRGKGGPKEPVPPDMAEVKALIAGAQHAVLFLAFNPGTPSISQWTAEAQKANPDLFVRGCVTSPDAAAGFFYELKGMTPPKKVKGEKTPPAFDPRVIAADALTGGKHPIPEGWQQEILSAGFAIIHDKIVVIDPFSDNCAVISGSHNLGHRASYNNDENLVIVTGNRKLAVAYATHVLDVYDHFSWRVMVNAGKADGSLSTDPEQWMGKYFNAKGEPKTAQLKFWLSATTA